jgi:hypothetical protein
MIPQQGANQHNKAFTLLEVMIFTTILSVVLVAAAAFTTRLVYNLHINEHKIYANIYSSELMEWLSSEREADWTSIYNKASNSPGTTYCVNEDIQLNTTIADTTVFRVPTVGNPCLFNGITGKVPAIYKRELILVRNGTNQVVATVRVSWQERNATGLATYSDESQAVFTSW